MNWIISNNTKNMILKSKKKYTMSMQTIIRAYRFNEILENGKFLIDCTLNS